MTRSVRLVGQSIGLSLCYNFLKGRFTSILLSEHLFIADEIEGAAQAKDNTLPLIPHQFATNDKRDRVNTGSVQRTFLHPLYIRNPESGFLVLVPYNKKLRQSIYQLLATCICVNRQNICAEKRNNFLLAECRFILSSNVLFQNKVLFVISAPFTISILHI